MPSASSTDSTALLEEALDALRRQAGGRLGELAPGQAVARGERGVRALRAAVGGLDAPEELLLELVRAALVEQLVGGAERRERHRDVVDRLGDVVEQVLPGFSGDVRHQVGSRLRVDHHSSP